MANEQNTQPLGKYLNLLPPLAQNKGNRSPVVNGKESGGGMWAVIEILEPAVSVLLVSVLPLVLPISNCPLVYED